MESMVISGAGNRAAADIHRVAYNKHLQAGVSRKYNEMEAIRGVTFKFGLANFKFVLKWKWFMSALKNTMLLTVVTVPISTILALLIAVALNSIGPLKRLLQTIFFLPYVTNSIAIGMVFAAMFNIIGYQGLGDPNMHVEIGIINKLLGLFGAEPINWINPGSSWVANFTVMVIYIVWNALPFKILILLGGLQSINKQYYDAAKVDGTSKARILTRITVPLLSPMIAYVVITGFIGGFKEYSSIVGVFGEFMGPQVGSVGSMITIVGLIYKVLPDTKYGYASAAALVLFAIIMVITLINLQVSKKRVHY